MNKFSTDQPTSCITFTDTSVLVITDKIYDIDLDDFTVVEFLDLDENPEQLSTNYPIAMFKINDNEFIVCFQDCGLFVDINGCKSRAMIKWNSISGQFAYSKDKLWVTYYNSVEVVDLKKESQHNNNKMVLSKNPQILYSKESVYLLEEKGECLSMLELS